MSEVGPSLFRVSRLMLFPVKGLKGIEVRERRLGPRGLDGDRRWMVVDADGTFLSQRSHPRMILIHAALDGGRLRLSTSGLPVLDLSEDPGEGPRIPVRIWNDRLDAVAPSPEADAWLSEALDTSVRLVHQPDDARRPTDARFAPDSEVSFADGYPILLISEASLAELNLRLAVPVPMDRFRPNVVVAADASTHLDPRAHALPHAEDRWRKFSIGGVSCAGVKLCARCSVTTVDTATGVRELEPLRTLATYRRWGGKVWFGQNVVPFAEGVIRVGDPVRVDEEGEVGG